MRYELLCLTACAALCAPVAGAQSEFEPEPDAPARGTPIREPRPHATLPATAPGAVTFHGGVILPHIAVRVLYTGSHWTSPVYATDKVVGLDSFYRGYGASHYAASADEYSGSNGAVGSRLVYQGYAIDPTVELDGANLAAVAGEVCKVARSGTFVADTAGDQVVFVYSDVRRPVAGKYCGYHAVTTCSGQRVQYAYAYHLDGDPACSAADTVTGHSAGLAALATLSAHELHEMRTDPLGNAWHDAANNEVGDKCAWVYPAPYVTFTNGTRWKLQGEWSNAAYHAGTGYPNLSGQRACVAPR